MTRISTYEEELEAFRVASAKFRQAQERYRDRKIGDLEFIEAKKIFARAAVRLDVAETICLL